MTAEHSRFTPIDASPQKHLCRAVVLTLIFLFCSTSVLCLFVARAAKGTWEPFRQFWRDFLLFPLQLQTDAQKKQPENEVVVWNLKSFLHCVVLIVHSPQSKQEVMKGGQGNWGGGGGVSQQPWWRITCLFSDISDCTCQRRRTPSWQLAVMTKCT